MLGRGFPSEPEVRTILGIILDTIDEVRIKDILMKENKEGLSERKMSDVNTMRQPLLVLMYKDILIVSNEIDKSLPSVIVDLLQKNKDLFPEDVPNGLPPIRGIEHQIDFIPGSSIPNRLAYRCNPKETKEIQKQVSELMEKGYVRESMSPCAVPVLLVPFLENVC